MFSLIGFKEKNEYDITERCGRRLEEPKRHTCFWTERLNIKKILILLNYDPLKTLMFVFSWIRQINSKTHTEKSAKTASTLWVGDEGTIQDHEKNVDKPNLMVSTNKLKEGREKGEREMHID